jgi:hypothetical protein
MLLRKRFPLKQLDTSISNECLATAFDEGAFKSVYLADACFVETAFRHDMRPEPLRPKIIDDHISRISTCVRVRSPRVGKTAIAKAVFKHMRWQPLA